MSRRCRSTPTGHRCLGFRHPRGLSLLLLVVQIQHIDALAIQSTALPFNDLLYSMLHLGGFDGDLDFYSDNCRRAGARRVLELGCGDGRVGAAICMHSQFEYVGVELCESFAERARSRLPPTAVVINADFLEALPKHTVPFDVVMCCANTAFCIPRHDLFGLCSSVLARGGILLFDVYNALSWHCDASAGADSSASESEDYEQLTTIGGSSLRDGEDDQDGQRAPLVRVYDEAGHEWTIYELDPLVDVATQRIVCEYDFVSVHGEPTRQTVTHHYALPEQLTATLVECGFEAQSIKLFGGFDECPFDPDESERLVVVARKL
mmetsp:Transcript_67058/g.111492  ORF Transcript_67058/g.111492 Transcript_67058/m.111492 type:complete len:321 (+) Transcript_67058:127-1089(+)|eukprot:CAMPEP_0119310454 /NCGR_PEP_ID=MMETSP1333-20130426/19512_1 /TAXON_ID=418940 /ORGANISM="Scyphosphaera apsteinii, Strain RCC1455" /LENGTH=320 /DNA_ID=CAMNT_0007314637 /DNA_START=127 /DNA_END=1089 /DNA_ORIENTATION=-